MEGYFFKLCFLRILINIQLNTVCFIVRINIQIGLNTPNKVPFSLSTLVKQVQIVVCSRLGYNLEIRSLDIDLQKLKQDTK